MKTVPMMLKTIHAQESKEVAHEKAAQVAQKLREMKLACRTDKILDCRHHCRHNCFYGIPRNSKYRLDGCHNRGDDRFNRRPCCSQECLDCRTDITTVTWIALQIVLKNVEMAVSTVVNIACIPCQQAVKKEESP